MKLSTISFGVFAASFISAAPAGGKKEPKKDKKSWQCLEKQTAEQSGCNSADACSAPKPIDAKNEASCKEKGGDWKEVKKS